jgi:hypothetical protein
LESVALVINILERVFSDHVKYSQWNREAIHAHPETIYERSHSDCDDEYSQNGADKDGKSFNCDQVLQCWKEEVHALKFAAIHRMKDFNDSRPSLLDLTLTRLKAQEDNLLRTNAFLWWPQFKS